ncbi:Cytochrome P450 [Sesbania bispinosa]|nr:Cytochrome P450 [Sesbania bispinosa]
MGLPSTSLDNSWWVFTLPAIAGTQNFLNNILILTLILIALLFIGYAIPRGGGIAWRNGRNQMGKVPIPGPRGFPIFGILFTLTQGLPHHTLASMASTFSATKLMAFSLGSTPAVITSDPHIAREILNSPHFANRPIKQSAKTLMFNRAIGFAPNGTYWRLLRKVASTHLFSPKRIAAHEPGRRRDCAAMLAAVTHEQTKNGFVCLRKHLQDAALDNIMGTVFGRRYGQEECRDRYEVEELHEMVREGFEVLGAFNWSDYVSWISFFYDPFRIRERCSALAPRVKKFVKTVLDEHRMAPFKELCDGSDFVDVLLSLQGDEKLQDDDMIAILWLVHQFQWFQDMANPVDLTEVLKLSCEMKNPLKAVAIPCRVV